MIMKRDKLLTISLLCPGRSDDVFKTLNSLKPILEKVDSELIIVDTGCSAEFRKRLEAYTNQIIPFSWTGDFAEARNVGVDNAHGRWFMTIDDDEWFIDTTSIIDFFNKGYYKKYTAALYTVRNYTDYEERGYLDSPALRIFNIERGQRWQGKIHEYILMDTDPVICALETMAKHFGYIYSSEEERKAKSERNIVPLLEMIEEEPENMYWSYQLLQEYYGIERYADMEKLAEECLEKTANHKSLRIYNMRNSFYYARIIARLADNDDDGALKIYKDAISDINTTDFGHAGFAYVGSGILLKKNEYEKVIECCDRYFNMYRKLKDDAGALAKQACLLMGSNFSEQFINTMHIRYLHCYMMLGRYDDMTSILDVIDWNMSKLNEMIVYFVMDMPKCMARDGRRLEYSRIIDGIVDSEEISYGLNANIEQFAAGDANTIKTIAENFLDCACEAPIVHRQKVLATSEQMRIMASGVLVQVKALRQAGNIAEADSIDKQLNGILEKMPVGI